jgi:hypothetical protein
MADFPFNDGPGADKIHGGLGSDTAFLDKDGTLDTVTGGLGHGFDPGLNQSSWRRV